MTDWCVPLSPLPARGLRALLVGGSPLLLRPLATRWGSALLGLEVPLYPLDACDRCVLLGEPLPLVASCVKHALLFGGYPLLSGVLCLAAR